MGPLVRLTRLSHCLLSGDFIQTRVFLQSFNYSAILFIYNATHNKKIKQQRSNTIHNLTVRIRSYILFILQIGARIWLKHKLFIWKIKDFFFFVKKPMGKRSVSAPTMILYITEAKGLLCSIPVVHCLQLTVGWKRWRRPYLRDLWSPHGLFLGCKLHQFYQRRYRGAGDALYKLTALICFVAMLRLLSL